MFSLIKNLFAKQKGKRTVVIFNDDGTERSTSYRFNPRNLWFLCSFFVIGIVIVVVFLMVFTPLGGFVYNQHQMRESVIVMQKQVAKLQENIEARNMQLQNLRQAVFAGQDSLFPDVQANTAASVQAKDAAYSTAYSNYIVTNGSMLTENAVAISNLLKSPLRFPVEWPVEGTLTRGYNRDSGHVGIDIAANKGTFFHAIADGVVVGKNWSLNYGYVLYIQHSNGIITVYKHAANITPEIGALVLKGDILGRVGNTGIISSGPHLHMEIWVNGVSQNPLHYLIKS